MSQPLFRGVIPALVTPFRDGAIDEEIYVALIERQIAGGVHGLVPVGTTGESATLTHAEHYKAVELCVRTAAGRVPVVAGAGSNSTAEAIELVRHAKTVGADAALVVTPYYNCPSQEGLYAHYQAINDAVQMPVLIYNVPTRTSVDISNDTVARLAELPNIVGIKDATGDMTRISFQRLRCGADWVLLSGDDPTALGYMVHGGHGCISVSANVAPEQCAAFYNDALSRPLAGRAGGPGSSGTPAQGPVHGRFAWPHQVRIGPSRPLRRGRTPAPLRRPRKPRAPRCWPPCGTLA